MWKWRRRGRGNLLSGEGLRCLWIYIYMFCEGERTIFFFFFDFQILRVKDTQCRAGEYRTKRLWTHVILPQNCKSLSVEVYITHSSKSFIRWDLFLVVGGISEDTDFTREPSMRIFSGESTRKGGGRGKVHITRSSRERPSEAHIWMLMD